MQISRTCLFSLVLIWIGSLITTSSYGANLTIAIDDSDWKPMSWVENGHVHGFEVELIKKALEAMGHNVNWRPLPWARLLVEVEVGNVDAAVGLGYTAERESFLSFPDEPTYQMAPIIVGKHLAKLKQALEAGNENFILATIGYTYGRGVDNVIKNRRIDVSNQSSIFKMLANARADYGIVNVPIINGQPIWIGLSNYKYIHTAVKQRNVFIGFSRSAGRAGMTSRFSKKLREIKKSDLIHTLKSKYLEED